MAAMNLFSSLKLLTTRPDKRLRVVINSLDRGGAETHLLRVLPGLVQFGWHVDILVLKGGGELTSEFKSQGIQVHEPPQILNAFSGLFLQFIKVMVLTSWIISHFIRERKAIIHFFLPEAYLIGATCALIACYPRPMLMSRRSLNVYQNKYPFIQKLERFFHKRMSRVLGNSQRVIEQLHTDEGVSSSKLELIYNGLDIAQIEGWYSDNDLRRMLHIQADAVVMTIVANLIPYKGHADLLQALAKVKKLLPDNWVLLCVGKDNGILERLEGLADECGVSKHIHWLGSRDDVAEILSVSDIGLLCSHEEGFSNAILEYMAAGLPVIATNVGGNAEAVLNRETGLIVPPHDPDAFSEKLLELANDADKREQYGKEGRARMHENFSLDYCVAAYHSLYLKLNKD